MRNKKFPQAESIFSFSYKTFDEIKDNAVFVVDSDVLLFLYEARIPSIQIIQDLYQELISLNRFFVPAQVAREFADKRGSYLENLQHFLKENHTIVKPSFKSNLKEFPPIVKSFPEYDDLKRIEQEIHNELDNFKFKILFKEYENKVESISKASQSWMWNDPIGSIYRELFGTNVVIDVQNFENRQAQIETEHEFRLAHEIPPVSNLAEAEDRGIGEFLKWQTMLQLGKEYQTNVVFITTSGKNNWFKPGGGDQIFPRHELCYEFSSYSKGMSFNITTLSQVMSIFNFDSRAVKDIEQLEMTGSSSGRSPGGMEWFEFEFHRIGTAPELPGVLLFRDKKNNVVHIESCKSIQRKLKKLMSTDQINIQNATEYAFHLIDDPLVAKLVQDKLKDKYVE